MLLNTKIFNATVETAKLKSASNPAMLMAIDRAVYEINRSRYWSFADGVLRIQSTTSRKLYVVDDNHTCEAKSRTCKHHVARRLMQRYTEALGVAQAEGKGIAAPAPMSWSAAGIQTANGWQAKDERKDAPLINPSLYLRGDKFNGIDI